MKKQYKFIFDLDGTLYQFDKGLGQTFSKSKFYHDIKNNAYTFICDRTELTREQAENEFKRIKIQYNDEISIGLEKEYGIDRYEYFANTWNLNPEEYVKKDDLSEILEGLKDRAALLTAAPRVWALNVLSYLNINQYFGTQVYTGEPDKRKPSVTVFQRIADEFGSSTDQIISIGDQEYSDITPAKSIGMKTVLIGASIESEADYQTTDVKLAIELLRKEGFI